MGTGCAYGELPVVAVLGIGRMGMPIACRLHEAGYTVHAWNRSRSKTEPLAARGAVVHGSAMHAVRTASVVITVLQDGDVVDDVLFRQHAVQALRPRTLVIDMSSIKPREAQDHAKRLADREVFYLDAPVSGGTVGAESGNLAIMAGGDEVDFDRAVPIFNVLGRATHIGPHGSGQLAKLANQMIVGITIGAVAEALLLCQRGGAELSKVRNAIKGGFAESRVLDLHGERIVNRDFAPRASMAVQLKDMRNALETAACLGVDAPMTRLSEELYASAVREGLGNFDHSGLFLALERRSATG